MTFETIQECVDESYWLKSVPSIGNASALPFMANVMPSRKIG